MPELPTRSYRRILLFWAVLLAAGLIGVAPAAQRGADSTRVLTAEVYARAENFLSAGVSGLVLWLRHAASAEPEPPAIRFNLWADAGEGFFSPEPWIGTQNCLNTGAGAVRLEPGDEWRWRIEIMPRVTRIAGFEWGTGFYINPVAPEDAAEFLRDIAAEDKLEAAERGTP